MATRLVKIHDEYGVLLDQSLLGELGIDVQTELLVLADDDVIYLKPIRFASDHDVDRLTGKIMATHAETLRKLSL